MNILFLCNANAFRSQLAEYFFKKLTDKHHVESAGIADRPFYGVPLIELYQKYPHTRKIVEKYKFDLTNYVPKKITTEMIKRADKIIAILESEDIIPDYLKSNPKLVYWKVEDGVDENQNPKSLNVHDEIIEKVKSLVQDFVNNLE